jgi:hypothetical protein
MKNPRMVTALKLLKKLQDKHSGVVESADLPAESRSLLVTTGFLRQVSKGWYVCSNPKDAQGDSTSWYASFWAFLSGYLRKRFGKRYCLNAEASLLLQTGGTVIPPQVTAVTQAVGETPCWALPFSHLAADVPGRTAGSEVPYRSSRLASTSAARSPVPRAAEVLRVESARDRDCTGPDPGCIRTADDTPGRRRPADLGPGVWPAPWLKRAGGGEADRIVNYHGQSRVQSLR